jgi:hypothetical protein
MLMLYGIGVNPLTGDIYLGGMGEDIVFLTGDGDYIADFQIGNPPMAHTFHCVFE